MRNKKRFQQKKNRGDWQSKRPRTAGVTLCPKCGKNHLGECLKEFGPNICYRCRQPGHLMRDCKALPPPAAQAPRGTNARVFTVAQGEVEASPSAVTGQLFFHTFPLYALIDSGATHSFMSHGMIERLGLKPVVVDQPIRIELPDGISVLTREMLPGESVMIHGRELLVDLIVFDMPDFDVILGMDFLGKPYCSHEGISVDPSKVEQLEWQRPKLVKEVRSFLGLAGYTSFVAGFAQLAKPLTALTKREFLLYVNGL
ncbi:uncharacterized protein LOC116118084 [Pistacia vera]|uniref:uncharacterized protein LOC116118084 n=1 Tax=Pistacia vera TaxID=55513 RepID=UPI0012635F80|nr:uncharacterized protein LOC116118084 [Pistacia vera]